MVSAPTHKATKVLRDMILIEDVEAECKTIHSFLGIEPIYNYTTGEEKYRVVRGKQAPATASLLIVDESSMISHDIYESILETVTTGRVNTVLFIGDPFQLLPVGSNNNENDVFKLEKQFQLTQIVRQAENSPIIILATKIRNMIESQEFTSLNDLLEESESEDIELFDNREEFLEDFYKKDQWYKEDKIISSFSNKQVDTFNADIRVEFWRERGINNPAHFLPSDMIRFKSALIENGLFKDNNRTIYNNNDEVMLNSVELVNHKDTGLKFWKCSVVGRKQSDFIRVIDPDSVLLFNKKLEQMAGIAKSANHHYRAQFWKDYYQFKNAFANIQYVFSATIHKLQGSTFDVAYTDFSSLVNNDSLSNDQKYRLAYVAVTRARNKVKILY